LILIEKGANGMEKNNLLVLSGQCAVFFNPMVSLEKNDKIDLLEKLTERCGNLLDGEPTMLPIPLGAPPDIPRLQLNSKDNSYAYGISLRRSDFLYNQVGDPEYKLTDICPDLFKYEKEILKIYKEEKNWSIARLSLLVNYIAELENDATSFISRNFLSDSPKYNSVELSLLKKDKLCNFKVNRWFRLRPLEKKDNILHLMIDLNTFAEENLNLNVEGMMNFYVEAVSYLRKEVDKTFNAILK